MSDRQALAERLNQAGLITDRLIPVGDGSKRSLVRHNERSNRESSFARISGNYGVYAGPNPDGDRWLIDVDVDDYADDPQSDGLEAVNDLPETFTVESPHTDGETGGHRYYLITGERVDERLEQAVGVKNPTPSWGEVRVRNQYVVGPGSELDACDKDWHDCSEPGEGRYRIANDAEIEEIGLEDLLAVLRASGYGEETPTGSVGDGAADSHTDTDDADGEGEGYPEALDVARNDPKIVTYLTEGPSVDFDADRSDADFYVCCHMVEHYVPEQQARQLLEQGLGEDNTPPTKVRERGDNYWSRTWSNARKKVRESDGEGSHGGGKTDTDENGQETSETISVDGTATYFIQPGDDGEYVEQVLNFALDVRSILRVNNREVIQADLKRSNAAPASVQFESRDMQKKQRFKDNVLSGKFGLTFTPPNGQSETVLNALNRYIADADVPVREGTHHIGLHSGEWVTPDATLTADGWADDPDTVHVARDVALERAVSLPTDDASYDESDVREIVTALPETRDTSRMLAALGWFYAAAFRPYIFGRWGAGVFNHLNVTGDTGSGKTTTLRYLWRAFGVDSDPFAVTDTKFAMLSALSASNALPVWYDEYKPSEIQDYRLDQFHDLYRKAATGGTATRGRADQTTEEYHTHAPVVVSGEEQIRRPAERRRSILVTFRQDVTEKGTDTRRAFKSLVGSGRMEDGELVLPEHAPDPTDHAVAFYRYAAGADPADLRTMWQDARELVWERRRAWGEDFDLGDMEVQGLQTVAFGWMVMRSFATAHDVAETDLPSEAALDNALRHVAGEVGPTGQRKSHMDRFVELFGRAAAAGYVEQGQQYDIVHEGRGAEEQVRIHLSRTYDALSKYARDHGLDSEEILSNPDDYRKRFKEASESDDGYVVTHSQPTPGIGRCVGIKSLAAMTQLEFDRSAVASEPLEGADATAADGQESRAAAADGGTDTEEGPDGEEIADATGRVRDYVRTEIDHNEQVSRAKVAAATGLQPEPVRHALDTLREDGTLQRGPDGDLRKT